MKPTQISLTKVGVAALLAFLAGGGAGWWLGTSGATPTAALKDRNLSNDQIENAAIRNRLTGLAADPRPNDPSSEAWQLAWRNLLRQIDPIDRTYQARRLAGEMGLKELLGVVSYVAQLPKGPQQEVAFLVLLERWGSLDGRSALRYALDNRGWDREKAVASVLTGWAARDSDSAWRWVLENPASGSVEVGRLTAVIRPTAMRDPDRAFALAASLPVAELRQPLLEVFAETLFMGGPPNRVLGWLLNLPAGQEKTTAVQHAVGRWANYEPQQAAQWAAGERDPEMRAAAQIAIAQSWTSLDPAQAAGWALRQPAGSVRADLVETVFTTWLHRDGPGPVTQWLNQIPSERDLDPTFQSVALELVPTNPEMAYSWAQAISDREDRDYVMAVAARAWMEMAPDAAQTKLINDPALSSGVREMLFGPSLPIEIPVSDMPESGKPMAVPQRRTVVVSATPPGLPPPPVTDSPPPDESPSEVESLRETEPGLEGEDNSGVTQ